MTTVGNNVFNKSIEASVVMSTGVPTHQPSSWKAKDKTATPENNSQNTLPGALRIEQHSAAHCSGHLGGAAGLGLRKACPRAAPGGEPDGGPFTTSHDDATT